MIHHLRMPCSIEKVRKIVATKNDMVDNLSQHLHLLRKVWQHCWTMPALEGILYHAFGASYFSLVHNSKDIHSSKPCLQLVFLGQGRLQVCCCRERKWSSLENVYPKLPWVKQIDWKLSWHSAFESFEQATLHTETKDWQNNSVCSLLNPVPCRMDDPNISGLLSLSAGALVKCNGCQYGSKGQQIFIGKPISRMSSIRPPRFGITDNSRSRAK